jgi:membrane protein DedA with SNARE-associated domain
MPFRLFFFWNALGGISWGVTYGLVGYYAGEAGAGVLARFGAAGAILLALIFVSILVLTVVRQRRRGGPPEADERTLLAPDQEEPGSS